MLTDLQFRYVQIWTTLLVLYVVVTCHRVAKLEKPSLGVVPATLLLIYRFQKRSTFKLPKRNLFFPPEKGIEPKL